MSNDRGELREDDRSALLRVARASIVEGLREDRSLERVLADLEPSAPLLCVRGLFVTLMTSDGPTAASPAKLRGCIGTMYGTKPLYLQVAEMARAAAFNDPRFPALENEELDRVSVQISVLSSLEPASDWRRIEVGVDGVQLELSGKRSVFLPQVALEQGWQTEQLLRHLSSKAGLDPEGWREARLSTFRTQTFSEACAGQLGG